MHLLWKRFWTVPWKGRVACTVTAPDGTQVRGLTQDNFRLFEDGGTSNPFAFGDQRPVVYCGIDARDFARKQNGAPAFERAALLSGGMPADLHGRPMGPMDDAQIDDLCGRAGLVSVELFMCRFEGPVK